MTYWLKKKSLDEFDWTFKAKTRNDGNENMDHELEKLNKCSSRMNCFDFGFDSTILSSIFKYIYHLWSSDDQSEIRFKQYIPIYHDNSYVNK